jgi:hypothetical protein
MHVCIMYVQFWPYLADQFVLAFICVYAWVYNNIALLLVLLPTTALSQEERKELESAVCKRCCKVKARSTDADFVDVLMEGCGCGLQNHDMFMFKRTCVYVCVVCKFVHTRLCM